MKNIFGLTFSLFIAISSPGLLTGCGGDSDTQSEPFLTISDHNDMGTLYGDQINYNRLHTVVIKNSESWAQFWNEYTEGKTPKPEMPEVDFNQDIVIGLFMEVGTPCTSLNVRKVTKGSKITVRYQIITSTTICAQVTSDKGEIISIKQSEKDIIFHDIID